MLTIFVGVDSVLRHKNAKWFLKKHQMITGHDSYFISHIHCHFPFNFQFKLKIEKRSRQFFLVSLTHRQVVFNRPKAEGFTCGK